MRRGAAEIGAWFGRLNEAVFTPLMADRRVDGAYDKTIAKLSAGLGDFPLRMLSPYRSITDEEFGAAQRTLRERFPTATARPSVSSRAAADTTTETFLVGRVAAAWSRWHRTRSSFG